MQTFDFVDCKRRFLQIKRILMRSDRFLLQRERTVDVVVVVKAMSEEKTRKILAWRTVRARDEIVMTTLPEKGEAADSVVVVVDLTAGEKDLKGTLTPQIRRQLIGREVASTGEEGDVEAEVAAVEGVVVDLAREVVEVAVNVVEAASAGSENSKEEAVVTDRKSLTLFLNPFHSICMF